MANKVIKEVKINDEVINKLETLHYEVESRKSIISNMIASGMATGTGFEKYATDYGNLFREYANLKNEITDTFIPSEYQTDSYSWNANFSKGTIEILG